MLVHLYYFSALMDDLVKRTHRIYPLSVHHVVYHFFLFYRTLSFGRLDPVMVDYKDINFFFSILFIYLLIFGKILPLNLCPGGEWFGQELGSSLMEMEGSCLS